MRTQMSHVCTALINHHDYGRGFTPTARPAHRNRRQLIGRSVSEITTDNRRPVTDRLVILRIATLSTVVLKEIEYGRTMDLRAGASTMSCESTYCCAFITCNMAERTDRWLTKTYSCSRSNPRTPTEDDTH